MCESGHLRTRPKEVPVGDVQVPRSTKMCESGHPSRAVAGVRVTLEAIAKQGV